MLWPRVAGAAQLALRGPGPDYSDYRSRGPALRVLPAGGPRSTLGMSLMSAVLARRPGGCGLHDHPLHLPLLRGGPFDRLHRPMRPRLPRSFRRRSPLCSEFRGRVASLLGPPPLAGMRVAHRASVVAARRPSRGLGASKARVGGFDGGSGSSCRSGGVQGDGAGEGRIKREARPVKRDAVTNKFLFQDSNNNIRNRIIHES
jgi:hypothetical protein